MMRLPVPMILLVVPVVSTLVGGLLAMRFRRSLEAMVALGAGLLLGAAFLDMLPEGILIGLAGGIAPATVLGITLLAFLAFFALELGLDHMARKTGADSGRRTAGRVAGSLLIFHSVRDGMAIGASYTASHAAGYAVALGIAAHDLGDGMNTVILTTAGRRAQLADYLFLTADALAPLAGGLLAAYWFSSARDSVVLLAVAAGFFIQMGASDFLPTIRKGEWPRGVLGFVALGAGLIWVANSLLGRWR